MKNQPEHISRIHDKVEEIRLAQEKISLAEAKEIEIKGTIMVEFMMRTDRLKTPQELGEYMKGQLQEALKEEWQSSRMQPVMSSFKYKQVK